LRWVARHPWGAIVPVIFLCLIAVSRLPFLGGEFLPAFREGHFVMGVIAAPGTSLEETMRIGKQISEALLSNPHIATIEQQIGRAEQGEDTFGPEKSEFHIELKPLSSQEEAGAEDEIREAVGKIRGINFELGTFVTDRIGESISGEVAPVVVNLFGDDLDVLDAKAAEAAKALAAVPGAADVAVKAPPGAPRMTVRLRQDRLSQLGLRPMEVLDVVNVAFQGSVVSQVYRENQINDVAVILSPKNRREPQDVGSLLVSATNGLRVPLDSVADIFLASGRASILHEGARRRQTVTCNPTRDIQQFVNDAKKALNAKVQLPAGTYFEFAGAADAQAKATRELLLNSAIASVGILMLLSVVLGNWRNLVVTLFNLPFALVGGVMAIYVVKVLGGSISLSMGALVGFVTLFGITTRNAIMLISHCEHLVEKEGMTWGLDTAIRGASERLIPILMTATVTALGLLPLALGSGEAGREIEGPMAIVILGGLFTSTVLNLLILPTLALRFGHFGKEFHSSEPPPVVLETAVSR
jgi:Cu/Ag efflux pump CusA